MAVAQYAELDGVTVGATELSVVSGSTSLATEAEAGAFQLWVDAGEMLKGDEYVIRGYEKVEATGGAKKVFFKQTLLGAQAENYVAPVFALMHGWDFTIQKIAGTDRAFDASIRQVG